MSEERKGLQLNPLEAKSLKRWLGIGVIVFLGVIIFMKSFVIVSPGHSGIVVRMGSVQAGVLKEGPHFIIPFLEEVVQIEVRVQKESSKQTAASKDLQTVSTSIAINYRLDESAVNDLYQNVGLDYKNRIIDPATSEVAKAVAAKYTAEELITKRDTVSQEIYDALKVRLLGYNLELREISITDFKFSEEFDAAIEAKQTAEQNAFKAKNDLERVKVEAEQTITSAKAEAESLRLKKQEVTPELVQLKEIEAQLEAIKKWDGKLPTYNGGGTTPFVDITGLGDKK